MPKKVGPLADREVRKISAPGMHAVGGEPGLYLQVLPSGRRTWVLRYSIGGKRREMGLGGYPAVLLKDARDRAKEQRGNIAKGIDPVDKRAAERAADKAEKARRKTFDWCASQYIEAHAAGWRNAKHAQQWRNTLNTYASPVIGRMPVQDITTDDVLKILTPIWPIKTETASRVRSRIELVMSWAKAKKFRTGENPAVWRGNLDCLLAKPAKVKAVRHHPALPYHDITAFMADLRAREGMGARALEFAILTAARSNEIRGATWDEIDLERRIWTVPSSRMKAGKEHAIPLSDAAVQLLRALPRFAESNLVFVGLRGKPLSDATLLAVTKRMNAECVPHGFRSTFRDWAGETTGHPREVIEHALAHQLPDKAEAAYARGTLLQKRRRLMDDWARFCAKKATGGDVVPLRRKKGAA
ncbi:tyrosine-type recombinase/integrase [Denitromonas ohlonensis]|uniref:DUF4102 domain-containing protein n=2 Tax=Denitromonas TaxID=139331 RepID=A0A557RLE1_9RHOO|nr:integrase arm-type DNA-binding domain-containing protein [Denitromonas ohlonensis]TVO65932.1 DUF4102 domain-containing protein [Denitromonas ohlonensis]TVO79525.1 DUF4102 domain-containing protein [Denitromonas ohlonensis]